MPKHDTELFSFYIIISYHFPDNPKLPKLFELSIKKTTPSRWIKIKGCVRFTIL